MRIFFSPLFFGVAIIIGEASGNYWDGEQDDIRVYDEALTQGEITNLYEWGYENP